LATQDHYVRVRFIQVIVELGKSKFLSTHSELPLPRSKRHHDVEDEKMGEACAHRQKSIGLCSLLRTKVHFLPVHTDNRICSPVA
jgi:hypothetical protein